MLVLKTQNRRDSEPEWVNVEINGECFRMTAMIERNSRNNEAVIIVVDAGKEFYFYRDSYDSKGNK